MKNVVDEFKLEFLSGLDDTIAELKFENKSLNKTLKKYFYDLKTLAYNYNPGGDEKTFMKFFERGMVDNFIVIYKIKY